jgi:epoxide hydrolase 4
VNDRSEAVFPDAVPGLKHFFIQVSGGVKLHAVSHGAGQARPLLVFLHGFPETWHSWRHQIAAFRDNYEILALDMRGFGMSDAPSGLKQYSMDRLCVDVYEVIKACGHTSCKLVAHDWGGAVAWCFAANYPSMVERLAILCSPHPAAYKDPKRFDSRQVQRSWYFLMFMSRGLPELWLRNRDFQKIDELMVQGAWGVKRAGAITTEDIERIKAALSRFGALTAAINYYRASICDQTSNPSPAVAKAVTAVLTMPVLLMYADSDAAFCSHMFDDTASNAANLTTVQIQDCSHWANQDRPEVVNGHLNLFFSSKKGGALAVPGPQSPRQ